MSVRNLDFLFKPKSVAVIGASPKPMSIGEVVMKNLVEGGFDGPVMPVNPKHSAVHGILSYPNVAALPVAPDLAILCTPPQPVPSLIAELGERGTRAAIVLTAGLTQHFDQEGRTLKTAMLEAARPHQIRILGPNCLGLLATGVSLNASFAPVAALKGNLAFVSQSGALCVAVLDWARSNGIGFSHFISLGDAADVDFGDALDYLGGDPETSAILLYIESIAEARKFMSAARAAARNKPVLAVKAGRFAEGAKAAASHTGALAGSDDVYDSALRRAGILRVFEMDELFDAVETLARAGPIKGDRLTILTNGGGVGVMTTDALIEHGGHLAGLASETIQKLDKILPPTWSRANPVDIIGDAPPERFAETSKILLEAPGQDALFVLHVPTAVAGSVETARAVISALGECKRCVLTAWLGGDPAAHARKLFSDAGIASYETQDQAVRGFMHMVRYRRNQELLMETPPSLPAEFTPDTARARKLIEGVIAGKRSMLTEPEAKDILAAYGIPVVRTRIAATPEEAVMAAREIGFPVALKILSPEITHKTDVGGVALNLESAEQAESAAREMIARLAKLVPSARITGFTVQEMARRPRAFELILGLSSDPVFGPIILFGQGGTSVEVIRDKAVALPPLNMNLAADLISRTRISRLLKGFRDHPPVKIEAVQLALIQLAQLAADFPEIKELDINPLFADENGVLALDARIKVEPAEIKGADRLAIRPYPKELEETVKLSDGRALLVRPIRPEDEPAHHVFHSRLTPDDIHFRFFGLVREFPHSQMARFTQIDYAREMAFIATAPDPQGAAETLGVVRVATDPDNLRAEFAIIIRSDLKGHGLGHLLLDKIIRYCRARGTHEIVGEVMEDNKAMLTLAHHLGFKTAGFPEGGVVRLKLELQTS